MILPILIAVIALIPCIIGIGLLNIYGKSPLINSVFLFLLFLTIWQLDVAVLYFNSFLSKDVILILFKLLRAGLIFAIPTIFLLSYIAVREDSKHMKKVKTTYKRIMNKYVIIGLYIWSFILYIILWTPLGVEGLKTLKTNSLNGEFYFPVYGDWNILFHIHSVLYIVGIIIAIASVKKIENKQIKHFMQTFMYSTIGLYAFAMFNTNPNSGILIGSIGVILFSLLISSSFTKMYNNILNNYNEVLERQSKLDYAGNITSSLIHEVKNGLSVIQGYSQILPTIKKFDNETTEIIDHIRDASTQLSEFVKSYQDFLKNQKITFEDIYLDKVLNKAISVSDKYIKDNNFKIETNIKQKKILGYVNKTYLTQVFVNLIKNSIEATPDEEERRIINIDMHVDKEHIVIDFKDNGQGVPENMWEKVFYPYNSNKQNGTGLGLPFCKQIIFSHRGEINIVDSNKSGTWFQIKLPRYKFTEFGGKDRNV